MKKYKMIILVILIYLSAFIYSQTLFTSSLGNTSYFIIEMLQVMPVIFVMTVAIEVWIPKESITKNLGETSKFKGTALSLLLGSISAGPIYAAFPVTALLLKKGASIKNVVIIISSWAVIKVPMLANEAKFLGLKFMALRWVLTVLAIIAMGSIASLIVSKSDILLKKESTFKVRIKKDKCIVCGLCSEIAPNHFEMVAGSLEVISDVKSPQLKEAKIKCPVEAIEI